MPDERYPPVRQMVREAVEELGSPTTNVAVRDWIREHYPGTNRGTVDAQRLICTVNQPSRVHYTENRRPRVAAAPVPITQAQIDAANRLHHKLPQWAASDRAFEQAAERFPHWDRESCVLKAAAINDLYSTRVYAIWRMAEHLMHVMADPPGDAGDLAAAIASLPGAEGGQVERRHWSFASKILHFFVDGDRFPIYDSYCRDMLAHHLGRGGRVSDPANPYRAFMANLGRLRDLSGLTASLRDLDRYLWLAGQYRDWLRKGEDARTNSELRSLFEHPSPQEQTDLATLLRT
jgi:hypothetical protein